MKILGILQNQWFKDPAKMREILARHPEYRRRFIARALFAGCQTGQVLKRELSEELCHRIVWEEASPEIGGYSASSYAPDARHVQLVVNEVKPDIIVGFGVAAKQALGGVMWDGKILYTHHPTYRRYDLVKKDFARIKKVLLK